MSDGKTGTATEEKKCPFCAETIKVTAVKCRFCGSILDGPSSSLGSDQVAAAAGAAGLGQVSTRVKPSELTGTLMLLVPAVGAILSWFWINEMALMQDPGLTLTLIACGVVLATAVLATIEASQLGMGAPKDLRRAGPVRWFLFIALLWLIGFPAYLHRRSLYGMKSLVLGGALLAFVFVSLLAFQFHRIEGAKAAVRGHLAALENAGPSGETLAVPIPVTPPREKPTWKWDRSSSPLDESPSVEVYLESEDAITGSFGKVVYPKLGLQCAQKRTNIYVDARAKLVSQMRTWSSDYSWGSSTRSQVRLRLDDDKPAAGSWLVSDDHEAVFAPQPIDFAKRLAKHDKLLVELDVYMRGTQMVTFNLAGLADELPELRRACKW